VQLTKVNLRLAREVASNQPCRSPECVGAHVQELLVGENSQRVGGLVADVVSEHEWETHDAPGKRLRGVVQCDQCCKV